jgi:predicted nucleic acid-binding protein
MRTTVSLDDALLDQARREAQRRGETLTALIEKGLRLELAHAKPAQRRPKVTIPVFRRGKGLQPGVVVQDAWFAALAIESGCEWITTDRDYARFEGLRWRAPF